MTTTVHDAGGVQLRLAERADLLDIVRIERASFPQAWPLGAFERFLGQPGFVVAVADSRVVGYVVADTESGQGRPIGHIKDLAVRPEWRRRGIGSRLLERAISVLTARGADRVKLEVRATNEDARALYKRFGFEAHHVVSSYYADGEDAIVLVAYV